MESVYPSFTVYHAVYIYQYVQYEWIKTENMVFFHIIN